MIGIREITRTRIDGYSKIGLALVAGALEDLQSEKRTEAERVIDLDFLLADGVFICDMLPGDFAGTEHVLDWLIGRISRSVAVAFWERLGWRLEREACETVQIGHLKKDRVV